MTIASLACPLCRGPLTSTSTPQHERCPRCGDYAVVGDVAVLTPMPAVALASLRRQVAKGRATLEHRRARAAQAAHLIEVDRATVARTLDAMDHNQALLESLARVVAPAAAAPAPLSSLFAERQYGWILDSLLFYFCADWGGPRSPARDRVADRVRRLAPDRGAALVLGACAGATVYDLAGVFDITYGIDLSLPALLLARRMLNGDRFDVHLKDASWLNISLHGATAPGTTRLLAGDAASLPLADNSIALVVTQYLLDVTANPAAVLHEINRVLSPGGIWINEGPPFRLHDRSSLAGPRTVEAWPDVVSLFGFETIEVGAVEDAHIDLPHLGPDRPTTRFLYHVISAATRKIDTRPAVDADAFAAYFAGAPQQLLSMKPAVAGRPASVSRTSTLTGDVSDRSVSVGSTRYPMTDEDSLALASRFLGRLDGATPVSRVIDAMTRGPDAVHERDVVLALHVLRSRGGVELL